jgi:hypothetical protein
MGFGQAILMLVAAVLGIAALTVDVFLGASGAPRRLVFSWLAWSAPGAACGAFVGSFTGDWAEIASYALTGAVLAFPAVRLVTWMSAARYGSFAWAGKQHIEPPAYQALNLPSEGSRPITVFAPPVAPSDVRELLASSETPPAAPPRTMGPDWAPVRFGLLATLAMIGMIGLWAWIEFFRIPQFDDAAARGAIAATLEMQGYGAPRILRRVSAVDCPPDSAAYQWAAIGSEGRACLGRTNGEIEIRLVRSWPSDLQGEGSPPRDAGDPAVSPPPSPPRRLRAAP